MTDLYFRLYDLQLKLTVFTDQKLLIPPKIRPFIHHTMSNRFSNALELNCYAHASVKEALGTNLEQSKKFPPLLFSQLSAKAHKSVAFQDTIHYLHRNIQKGRFDNFISPKNKIGFYHAITSNNGIYLDSNSLFFHCAMSAPLNQAIFLHGAAFAPEKKGLLFLGQSGIGKSTLVNTYPLQNPYTDESILLKYWNDRFWLIPNPFYQFQFQADIPSKSPVPVEAVCFLEKGTTTQLVKLDMLPHQILEKLITHVFFFSLMNPPIYLATMELLIRMAKQAQYYTAIINPQEQNLFAQFNNTNL